MWDLAGPEMEPVHPAVEAHSLTTAPPEKSLDLVPLKKEPAEDFPVEVSGAGLVVSYDLKCVFMTQQP